MEFLKEWWSTTGLPVLLGGILAGVLISLFYVVKSTFKDKINE